MGEKISSSLTYCVQILFPALWITVVAPVICLIWLIGDSLGLPLSNLEFYLAMTFWLVVSGVSLWFGWRLRGVRLEDEGLMISNFGQLKRIPMGLIQSIHERGVGWPRTIHLHLAHKHGIPPKVIFLAPMTLGTLIAPFSSHPTVAELHARIEAAGYRIQAL